MLLINEKFESVYDSSNPHFLSKFIQEGFNFLKSEWIKKLFYEERNKTRKWPRVSTKSLE